jgi:sulfofructose kinase
MKHIAFVGHAVWDHIFSVPRLTAEPGKWVAQRYEGRPGGMGANAALAAQGLRAPLSPQIKLVSPMGDDEIGQQLASALRASGVTLVPECIVAGERTGVSAVLVDAAGERQGHGVRGTAQARAPLPSADWFSDTVALQVDPRWPEGAKQALQLARDLQIVSLLDADTAPSDVLRDLAPLADWVVFSSDGLRAWADDTIAPIKALFSAACTQMPHTQLAVTLGAQGLLWRPPGQSTCAWPAYAVDVVNTNGAGDALHGCLLLALAEGATPEAALRLGMAAGALTCTGRAFGRADVLALASAAPVGTRA